MRYQAPRGTQDILPEERPYWRHVEEKAHEICRLYGYTRIETPTFEDTGLFTRGVGDGTDIVTKEMYTFDDRGGNSITLRPEGTASVCRAYLENGMSVLPKPVKLYYFASIFRYERPQAGRLREHHQFGFEAIGDPNPALDAEVIDMSWQFFSSLGLRKLKLQLNSIGCKACRPGYVAKLREFYAAHREELCDDCRVRLEKNTLRLLDCKQKGCQALAEAAPKSADHLCPECADHFSALKRYLDALALPYEVNHRLVRGLDYYTRTVYEVQPELEGSQSTLGGGGRYDDLIEELGGAATPAIGLATGIERLVLNLKREGVAVAPDDKPRAFVATVGEAALEAGIRLTGELRRQGVSARMAYGRSLKAQFKQAGASGAAFTIILGDDEIAGGTAELRDMALGEQKTVPLADLARLVA
jgi:histidyl-tRNA synthetase